MCGNVVNAYGGLNKMDCQPRWHELIERAANFYESSNQFSIQTFENEQFFTELHTLYELLITGLIQMNDAGNEIILKKVFTNIYNFVVRTNDKFIVFGENSRFHSNVFEACFFTALCLFIQDSKRVKGLSLRKFVYNNSLSGFNVKNSTNYFDYNEKNPDKYRENAVEYQRLIEEDVVIRQMKHRLLQFRNANTKRPEWSTMPGSSEHEWSFHYVLKSLSKESQETYKRVGNLNNDIIKVFMLSSPKNDNYNERVDEAFKKFSSKLKKLKYEKYLKLQKEILAHICEDKTYYGMNIYRFEKQLRLYNISDEVKRLLECKDEDEENQVIKKSIILSDIHFPKIYQDFCSPDDPSYTAAYATIFFAFRDAIVGSCRLIYDALIDNGYFTDWETFFLSTINEMTEKVFYNPAEIDYTVTPKSQEKFEKIISASPKVILRNISNTKTNTQE